MDTLLLLLFPIPAYDRRIHQEYIFYIVKSRNIRCRKKGGKQGMEYFTQERRRFGKMLPPGGIRNNGNSKGTGGSRKDTEGKVRTTGLAGGLIPAL